VGLICVLVLTVGCYQDAPAPALQATLDILISLLDDPDVSIRLTAAEALGKIGNQKAEPFLFRALHDPNPIVREAAARSIGRLSLVGFEAEAELVMLLRDPDISVRNAAAQALGNREGAPGLASILADLLTHPDPTVRQTAGHALFLIDGRKALAALSKGATDPDPIVRQWAVAALGEAGDARTVPLLLERLRHDSADSVRAEAAYRLRFFDDDATTPELETIMREERNPDIKRWAAKDPMDSGSVSTPIQRLD
jgi:HEAT repeat protein